MSCLDGLLEQACSGTGTSAWFDHQSPGWFRFACVEVLVDAVVVNNRDIARAPVVPDIVVDLVTLAVKNIESGLVHVPVLL